MLVFFLCLGCLCVCNTACVCDCQMKNERESSDAELEPEGGSCPWPGGGVPTMVGHHRHHRHRRQRRHHHRARGLPVEHHGETPSPSNPPRPAANCASILKYLSFWFRLHCKNYELRTSCEKLFTNEIFVYRSAAIKYKDTLNNVWGGESIYFMYQCPL